MLPQTIKHHETFVRSPSAGFDGVFDWTWTQGHFGEGKITPMDFDGVVERKGNFIVFETKGVNVPVPKGQLITLDAAYNLGVFTILFIEGKADPEAAKCWFQNGFYGGRRMEEHRPTNREKLGNFVGKWYEFADANPVKSTRNNSQLIIDELRSNLAEARGLNALLLREYLIEKSGSLMNDGWHKKEADREAAAIAAAKFSASYDFCLGVLSRI